MNINKNKGLTMVVGHDANINLFLEYDKLKNDKTVQVYSVEKYSTNIRNNMYRSLEADLRCISSGFPYNKKPMIVFLPEFDFAQSIGETNRIKKAIKNFIDSNFVPVHFYIVASTYEMCRGEEVLNINTNMIQRFVDYEAYRRFMLTLEG
jgi:hypothetical protein